MNPRSRPRSQPGSSDRPERREDAPFVPDLTAPERAQARVRATVSADVVHEVIREQGEGELERSISALWWSGLAAGLSMGLSLLGQGLIRSHVPQSDWQAAIASLGYTLGFLAVILGRQQLFTESTVTAVIPLLSHRDLGTLRRLARLWLTVLAANIVGALAFAVFAAHSGAFPLELRQQFRAVAEEASSPGAWTLFARGVVAGWIIALMVWMLPAAGAGRLSIVLIMTFFIGLGQLSHIVAGSVEVLYGVVDGDLSWTTYVVHYFGPTLAGNAVGGVLLVAALNHAQVVSGGHRPPPGP